MLLQFSVQNFRTFREKASLSLVASNDDRDSRENGNLIPDSKFNLRILKSVVVYGANASGKSKFFEALMFMRHFVITSSKDGQRGDKIDVGPFWLNDESEKLPTEFEVTFIHENVMFRYGFEADQRKIISEWLYYRPKTKEIELFYRGGDQFETHERNFSKGKTVIKEGLVRDNALLVSVSAQFNDATSIAVIDWFKKLKTISGLHESCSQGFTLARSEDPIHKARILDLLRAADLGILDIRLQKREINTLPKEMPKEAGDKIIREINEETKEFIADVRTTHKKFDSNKNAVDRINFSLDDDESSGTRKFFALTGPILDAIENGYTLVVDDLDSRLHPNLVCEIVSLFNAKGLNKKNAQLIFNTHDSNLLSAGLFRRDQIWFTDKNRMGEARLYSLADIKSEDLSKTAPFEVNYLRGKYGAVPFLGFFDGLNNMLPQGESER